MDCKRRKACRIVSGKGRGDKTRTAQSGQRLLDVPLRHAMIRAISCQKGATNSVTSTRSRAPEAAPPPKSRIDRAAFEVHRGALNLTLNRFFIDYLLRVHRAFDGDIEEAILLGVVAHHNFMPWVVEADGDARRLEALLSQSGRELERLPINAYSIAIATGIPRETVRRKLARLVGKGWLEVKGRSEYFVTAAPEVDFASFTFELLHLFLGTADQLRALVEDKPVPPATPRPRKA